MPIDRKATSTRGDRRAQHRRVLCEFTARFFFFKRAELAMPRHPIALALPPPYPLLPTSPLPSPSPLQSLIATTLSSSDYDAVCIPLTNDKWQERWERLCLRPAEDEDAAPEVQAAHDLEREKIDRQADVWRREGGLKREEVNVCRLEETQSLVGIAAEWMELDSPDEGIRFDSELVRSPIFNCCCCCSP